jgi:hypothetical protein
MSFSSWLRSWNPLVTPRKGTVRSPQPRYKRYGPLLASRPCLEALEDRWLPSAAHAPLADVVPHSTGAVAAAQRQLPFHESLTLVSVSDTGVATYEGTATYFGHVRAVLNPDNTFTKYAANGDTAFGYVTHATATTGAITITGGTGRFQGATGTSSYVLSVDPNTGVTTVEVTGTISFSRAGQPAGPAHAPAARSADSRVVPIQVTGEGGTPDGLPVFVGGTASYHFSGTASHLGRYTGEGRFELVSLDPATLTGTFRASFVFVAANGDRLAVDTGPDPANRGTFALTPTADGKVVARFVGPFLPVPALSTGRFADVTGGIVTLTATSTPFSPVPNAAGYTEVFSMTWGGNGSLVFRNGR